MAEEMDEAIDVWKQVFQELMQEVKPRHKWTITQDDSLLPGVLTSGWMQYQQKTFARFQCSSCCRSWASGHVLVLFHIHWSRKRHRGQVKMRVFSQRCKKCPEPPFEIPEFRQVNVTRLLNNLVFKILKKCYREEFEQVEEIPAVEDISLEGPHDSNNCEACLQGFCAQSGLGLTSKSRMSPEPPTSSKLHEDPSIAAAFIHITASQPPTKVVKTRVSTEDPKAYTMETNAKVSHTPKPSTIPTQATPQSPWESSTSSKLTGEPRVTATSISVPGSQPPTKVAKTRAATEIPRASDFIKIDPNTSYSSRPAAIPVLANQWTSTVLSTRSSLTVEPMVTASCISIPCSQPPTKAAKTRASTEDPKASYLTKTDPKSDSQVRHTLDPSTAPSPATYWSSPRSGFPLGFGNRMPPPPSSQTAENTAASGTHPKTPKASTSSSLFAAPTTQNPPRDHICQVELHPSHEPGCCSNCAQCCLGLGECCPSHEPYCCSNCMGCCLQGVCSCRACLFLIFVVIAVLLIVKNII